MLRCIPYRVPNQVPLNQNTEIGFAVYNQYSQKIAFIVFIAYCDNYKDCSKYEIVWHTNVIELNPGDSKFIRLVVQFKKAGYYGIGVWNVTLNKGECGFIINATGSTSGGLGQIGQVLNFIQMLIWLPFVMILFNVIGNAINNLLESIRGGGKA